MYASTCGWSATKVVNQLVVVAWNSMRGHPAQAKLFQERVNAAVALYVAQKKHEAEAAALRKVEREAASKIKPPHLAEITPPKAT